MTSITSRPLCLVFAAAAAGGLLAGASQAAVSGFYDSAARIEAILASTEVADALRQAPIRSVEEDEMAKGGDSVWVVRSQDCDLQVTLRATPPAGVGKTKWVVESVGGCE